MHSSRNVCTRRCKFFTLSVNSKFTEISYLPVKAEMRFSKKCATPSCRVFTLCGRCKVIVPLYRPRFYSVSLLGAADAIICNGKAVSHYHAYEVKRDARCALNLFIVRCY